MKNYFCSASTWIAKFKWLTSRLGSLFPGETGERTISLLKSLNQTAWSSAGGRGLYRNHILLSSKPHKLFIWSGRRAAKGKIYWQLLLLSFFFFPFSSCWRKRLLKFTPHFFFSRVRGCMLYTQYVESMLELKAKYQSIGSDTHVLWLIKCKWAKLFSEKVVYTPKSQKCEPSL